MKKILQKNLHPDKLRDLRWGSHIPTNTSILKTFPINGILELGAGLNSTPLFFSNCNKVITIENDLDWINKLKNENLITESENHKIIYHNLPKNITRSTHRNDISNNILRETIEFYKSNMTSDLNFLFVDGYAGLRLETLTHLHKSFDIITYHDAEPRFDKDYDYSHFIPSKEYFQIFDRTFSAHVGILISKKFENLIPLFKENFKIEAEKYADKFNTEYKVFLE